MPDIAKRWAWAGVVFLVHLSITLGVLMIDGYSWGRETWLTLRERTP